MQKLLFWSCKITHSIDKRISNTSLKIFFVCINDGYIHFETIDNIKHSSNLFAIENLNSLAYMELI